MCHFAGVFTEHSKRPDSVHSDLLMASHDAFVRSRIIESGYQISLNLVLIHRLTNSSNEVAYESYKSHTSLIS